MNHRHTLPFAALLLVQTQTPVPPAPAMETRGRPTGPGGSAIRAEVRDDTTVRRAIRTINYRLIKGSTRIGFQAGPLHPDASGSAKIKTRDGITQIKARFDHLPEPWPSARPTSPTCSGPSPRKGRPPTWANSMWPAARPGSRPPSSCRPSG